MAYGLSHFDEIQFLCWDQSLSPNLALAKLKKCLEISPWIIDITSAVITQVVPTFSHI